MGLHNRVTGSTGNETRMKEPKPFKPIELEQAFDDECVSRVQDGSDS